MQVGSEAESVCGFSCVSVNLIVVCDGKKSRKASLSVTASQQLRVTYSWVFFRLQGPLKSS